MPCLRLRRGSEPVGGVRCGVELVQAQGEAGAGGRSRPCYAHACGTKEGSGVE